MLRAAGRPRLQAVRRVPPAAGLQARPARAVPAPPRRGALLASTTPTGSPTPTSTSTSTSATWRSPRPATRTSSPPGRPHHRPADGPLPAAVGGVRPRGPRGRRLRRAHEDPPRHDRRRLGRPAAEHALHRRAGRRQRRPPRPTRPAVGIPASGSPARWRCSTARCVNLARRPGKALRLQLAYPAPLRRDHPQHRAWSTWPAPPAATCATSRAAGSERRRPGAAHALDDRAGDAVQQDDHRRTAAAPIRSVPLEDIKALKTALDATVNDVVMADLRRGPAPLPREQVGAARPIRCVAMIPVSIRTGNEPDLWTNRVSGLVVRRCPPTSPIRSSASRPCTRRWTRPRSSSSWCRPTCWSS